MRGDDKVIASGGEGPVPLHDQPLEALQGRPRSGGWRRGQARRRHPGRPPDARPHARLHHLDLARRERRQDLRRRRHRQPQRQPRLPAGRQQGLSRDRRRLRQDVRGAQEPALRRVPRRPRRLLRHGREVRARQEGDRANPFVDPEGYREYVAQKERAFRETLAAQQATATGREQVRRLSRRDQRAAAPVRSTTTRSPARVTLVATPDRIVHLDAIGKADIAARQADADRTRSSGSPR